MSAVRAAGPASMNIVILRGLVHRGAETRELPTGVIVVAFELLTSNEHEPQEVVPVAWHQLSGSSASSNGRCTVPVMMAGAVDPHRPLEIPGCQACRCRCLNARRSVPR